MYTFTNPNVFRADPVPVQCCDVNLCCDIPREIPNITPESTLQKMEECCIIRTTAAYGSYNRNNKNGG